ncbi:MAG: glycosyltransferase family 2 protein [Planctomycetes bacterium]|nr:glycosyltransferase family 2 protein [Planctomycetota bacterium]
MHDVGVVIVNFNSGRLTASAVRSLRAQKFRGRDGGPGSLQIVVVDNLSPTDQHAELDPLRALGVTVIYHDRNDGYGPGMNLGMKHVDAEFVLLSNPDVLVLDGALSGFVDVMRSDPGIGAVGPRGYLDPDLFILLPQNDLPTLSLHIAESLGRVHQGIARRASFQRSRRFLRAWLARTPQDCRMISGFAMMLRADLARRLGPFDEGFPFYFEDADLCRRVTAAGARIVLAPAARMIHFFDQSARTLREEVQRRYHVSRARYYRKHYGALGAWAFDRFEAYAAKRGPQGQGWRFLEPTGLGALEQPLAIDLPSHATTWVMELATDPAFLFCGGHVGSGPRLEFPARAWNALEATTWFVRVLDVGTLEPLAYVTFSKSVHTTGPIAFEEL